MKLWTITLRGLGITEGDRAESTLHVVCAATTERALMEHLYACKFTREWWAAHIVTGIEGPMDIWHTEEPAAPVLVPAGKHWTRSLPVREG